MFSLYPRKKKGNVDSTSRKDGFAAIFFFLSGFYLLSTEVGSAAIHAIGICCILASVYGYVCLNRHVPFLFKN